MLDGVVFSSQQIGVNTFYIIKWGTHYKAGDPVIIYPELSALVSA
jgi:hypothetical protein